MESTSAEVACQFRHGANDINKSGKAQLRECGVCDSRIACRSGDELLAVHLSIEVILSDTGCTASSCDIAVRAVSECAKDLHG